MNPTEQPITMTSRETADLVEKRHDNVKRTIETLARKGVIAFPQSEETPTPGGGPASKTYHLCKRDTFVVIAQLSPEFTARVVDRWQELEGQSRPDPMAMLNDPDQRRGLLLTYTDRVMALESTMP